ncbi:(+)-pulegone reductase [Rhizoctonia solani AG-1 IB]|uniref:(+)-pulegone reductase n=1 Tax=Thanatephorus cucumeris (strain AG1-IB / isolate 7/3/14) TaxID=1108050 RepID=M5CAB4_THACB|nr:(+)-pulegone reductase [Rhizoctonia solani AG-1 IB]
MRVVHPEPEIPLSAYVNILGMPVQAAFYGLELIGGPKAGETFYVSAGAGTVGSIVAQLAKVNGLKVIASAGSSDKVEAMKRMAKEGSIDIYWDHIGGRQLELRSSFPPCAMDHRGTLDSQGSGGGSKVSPDWYGGEMTLRAPGRY